MHFIFTMKLRKVSMCIVLQYIFLCGLVAEPIGNSLPSKGPKLGETGRYVYSEDGVSYKHCLYCDADKTFSNDDENKRSQEFRCVEKYTDIKAEITQFERENELYPVCKIGKVPGCGPPPEIHKTADDTWICDPGFSNKNYSVYFSCTLVNKRNKAVTWSYYCNESLQWDEDLSFAESPPSEKTTRIVSDDKGYKTVFIAAGVFLVLVVILLCGVLICIVYRRNYRDVERVEDSESRSSLMNVDSPPVKNKVANLDQGSLTSTSRNGSETGNDVTERTNADDKTEDNGMSSVGRLPPYGQEERKTIGCQTAYSAFSQNIASYLENEMHNNFKETRAQVRAELSDTLVSSHPAYQPPCAISSTIERCQYVHANNSQKKSVGTNNLNKVQESLQSKEAMRNQRPTPLGNISDEKCSENVRFDDEDDNRHNTELKQLINERQTEIKKSNNCCCHSNLPSQQSRESRHTDISHQQNLRCACAHDCESRCATRCAKEGIEKANEMLNRQEFNYDQMEQGDNESFEIYSYQMKPQKEFYA